MKRLELRLDDLQMEAARKVLKGDYLEVQPFWNATTRTMKIESPARVLAVLSLTKGQDVRSQSGIQFLVTDVRGVLHWLDAAWFIFDVQKQMTLL